MPEKIKKNVLRCVLPLFFIVLLAGCGGEPSVTAQAGETVYTTLFNFTVSDVQTIDSYTSIKAPENEKLVCMKLSVENTSEQSCTMFAEDFQIQWGDGDDDFGTCLAAVNTDMVPYSYTLEPGESYTGTMVVAVPSDCTKITIAYQEFKANGDKATAYFVEASL